MLKYPLDQVPVFYQSPLSVVERFQRVRLIANEEGELRLQKSEDCPSALEDNKKEARNTWATTRLNRGLLFTGYPGCINVPVRHASNDWELWKNILQAEHEWVNKQWAARVRRKEEPNELETDPKRQRTMTSDPHSIFTGISPEVVMSPPKDPAYGNPASTPSKTTSTQLPASTPKARSFAFSLTSVGQWTEAVPLGFIAY